MSNPNWYVEFYDLIEQRLIDSGLSNVGPALSKKRTLPSVEPWIAGNETPDPKVAVNGGVGDPRMIVFGAKITVAKDGADGGADGGAMRRALGLLGQAEESIKAWIIPVVGVIRPRERRILDSPQAIQERSGVKNFNADGDSVWVTLFYIHLYVDQFEVKI